MNKTFTIRPNLNFLSLHNAGMAGLMLAVKYLPEIGLPPLKAMGNGVYEFGPVSREQWSQLGDVLFSRKQVELNKLKFILPLFARMGACNMGSESLGRDPVHDLQEYNLYANLSGNLSMAGSADKYNDAQLQDQTVLYNKWSSCFYYDEMTEDEKQNCVKLNAIFVPWLFGDCHNHIRYSFESSSHMIPMFFWIYGVFAKLMDKKQFLCIIPHGTPEQIVDMLDGIQTRHNSQVVRFPFCATPLDGILAVSSYLEHEFSNPYSPITGFDYFIMSKPGNQPKVDGPYRYVVSNIKTSQHSTQKIMLHDGS